MHAPELGGTELPSGSAHGPHGPVFVDELVRDVRIEQREVFGGTGLRQRVHAVARYPFQTVASGFSFSTSDSESFDSAATTCAKTCNTLLQQLVPWLLQWHNDVDVEFGVQMGDYFRDYVADETRRLGKTEAELRGVGYGR